MNKRSRRFLSIFSAAALLLGGVLSGVSVAGGTTEQTAIPYEVVGSTWMTPAVVTELPTGSTAYTVGGDVAVTEADYTYSDTKYYPRVLEQQVELRAGESLYVVVDATTENNAGFLSEGWDSVVEWYMHITDVNGAEVGTFHRGINNGVGTTQREHGLTLAYSYTLKNDWSADNADEHLLDNYAELQYFADKTPDNVWPADQAGVWAPGAYSPVGNTALCMVNAWSALCPASNSTYLARPVLQYTATTAGTYTVHAFASTSANVYVLRDQRESYTVLASAELTTHTDPLEQTSLTGTSVTMEQGDALYFVLDPGVANGEPVGHGDALAEFQSLTIQKKDCEYKVNNESYYRDETYAIFGKYPDSVAFGTQKGTGFIYGYSYTARTDWSEATADEHLLDNYGMMSSYVPADVWDETNKQYTTNYGGKANCATWRPVVSGVDLGETCMVGNHYGSLVADTTDEYIARPVLKFVAPSDGTYVISDSNYKEWESTASTLYLLLEEPLTYDPVEAWRVTPDVVSNDPTDPNFRLDAANYEDIQFPEYSKDNPAHLEENTYTEDEKQAQRDAGNRMQDKINTAVKNGEHTVVIEPGVYRFNTEPREEENKGYYGEAIVLRGAKDLTIIGYGAELIMEYTGNAFWLDSCENVTLVGFTVDRDPYRHVQFEIEGFKYVSGDVNGNWQENVGVLSVKIMDGYDPEAVHGSEVRTTQDPDDTENPTPLATNDLMYGALWGGMLPGIIGGGDNGDDYSIQFFDEDGIWQQQVFTHYYGFRWTNRDAGEGEYIGVYPIHLDEDDLTPLLGATILPGGVRMTTMFNSDSCNFVDIVNYGGSMMTWGVQDTGDGYYLRNKDIVRPGTNSLIAGGWGWVEFLSGGPIIEDCVYSRTNDDAADVLSWTDEVMEDTDNSKTLKVYSKRGKDTYRVGDVLRLYKRDEGTLLYEVTIDAVQYEICSENEEEVAFTLTLSEPVTVSGPTTVEKDGEEKHLLGDMVENYSRNRADQIVIKGTLFHDVFIRVLLQGTKSALIENNVFMRIGCSAIQMPGGSIPYDEGKSTENVVIRDNTFVHSPYGSQICYDSSGILNGTISIGMDDARGWYGTSLDDRNTTKSFRDITIEDNRFYGSMFSAIQVKNVDGLIIRNNEIHDPYTYDGAVTPPRGTPYDEIGVGYYGENPTAAIVVYACDDVIIEGNTVETTPGRATYYTRDIFLLTEDTKAGDGLSKITVTGDTELLSLSNVDNLTTWTLTENPMDGYTCAVTVDDSPVDVPNAVTVDGDKSIVVSRMAVHTISAAEYLKTDGTTLWLVTLNGAEQQEGQTYTYNGAAMFWSEPYDAYCALVPAASEAEAAGGTVATAAGTATAVAYAGDINSTDKVDTNDAQAVYNLYSGYTAWDTALAETFLRADVNGDGAIDILDAVMIVNGRIGVTA